MKFSVTSSIRAYLLLSLLFISGETRCFAKNTPEDLARDYLQPEESMTERVNSFRVVDVSKREKTVTVSNATAVIKLLTPLNSTFHHAGDSVRAEVISSSNAKSKPWLPSGTILTGYVEQVDPATFGRTDAAFHIGFYEGSWDGNTFDLTTIPSSKNGALTPLPTKLTKKAKVQNLLMAATFIAVPLALGTGGTSLAIRSGAGMVIGGALAEKGHHISGAVNGAWEGAGLGVLDPLVKKGHDVVMPEGTTIAITLSEPTSLKRSIVLDARRQNSEASSATLSTNAKIVSHEDIASIRGHCNQLLNQGDTALALDYLDKKMKEDPDNENIQSLKQRVAAQAIGLTQNSQTLGGFQ